MESAGCRATHVTFKGPCEGKLTIAAGADALRELASGILGLEPDDEMIEDSLSDVVGELANVVLGNLLPRLAGEEKVFDLGAPTPFDNSQEVWSELTSNPECVALSVEGAGILVHLEAPELLK